MEKQGSFSTSVPAFLAGLAVGVLIGGATAVLLTPKSGADTRAAITDRVDMVNHKLQDLRQQTEGLLRDFKGDMEEWAQRTRAKISPVKEPAATS